MGSQSSGDEEVASLLQRSHISSVYDHDLRFDNRNSEDVHKDALSRALAEHERIRLLALRAYRLNEAREAQERLRLHTLQEEERVRILTERAEEECRLREIENKARQIPKPAPLIPRAPTPLPVEQLKPLPPPVQSPTPEQSGPQAPAQPEVQQPTPQNQVQTQHQHTLPSIEQTPFRTNQQPPKPPLPPQVTFSQQPQQPADPLVQTPRPTQSTPASHLLPNTQRYLTIHQNLKDFRRKFKDIQENNKAYKIQSSNMRRKLRMALGQLTFGEDNKRQMNDVAKILQESLTIQSEVVDPSPFVVSIPEPNPAAKNNVDQLPSLFIWLLNMFAKNVVTQLATEASRDTRSAEPLGLTVAKIFSTPDFYWRGKSLIDMLIAKMTKECPVIFGGRGDAKMQGGRAQLGWRKVQGDYVSEQEHLERMTGIGAGYAAISLRNFSRSSSVNPWPPYHYWQSMATIVSTPPEHITATHCTVLKTMIQNFEVKFLNFYGDSALAALRVALIDFPARAIDQHDAAVRSLTVLADKMEQDYGLALRRL